MKTGYGRHEHEFRQFGFSPKRKERYLRCWICGSAHWEPITETAAPRDTDRAPSGHVAPGQCRHAWRWSGTDVTGRLKRVVCIRCGITRLMPLIRPASQRQTDGGDGDDELLQVLELARKYGVQCRV